MALDRAAGDLGAYFWDPVAGFTDIGSFGGNTDTYPADIDERGRIVGSSALTHSWESGVRDDRAFIWDRAQGMRSLGTHGTWSCAFVIDESAVVAGLFGDERGVHLFRWTESTGMVDLGVVDSRTPANGGSVRRIGSDGSIYGWTGWRESEAFRWSPSKGVEIWPRPSADTSLAGVTDDGRWFATTGVHSGSAKAVVWTPGGSVVELLPNATQSWALGNNGRGDALIVGDDEHPWFWNEDRGLIELTDGRGTVRPWAISENGYVTGQLFVAGQVSQPFVLRLHFEPLAPVSVSTVVAPANVTVSWSAPPLPEGDDPPTAYRIYRDDILIGTIDAATTSFVDHDPLLGLHTYTVIAENAFGSSRATAPATVIVTTTVRDISVAPTATPVPASPTFAG